MATYFGTSINESPTDLLSDLIGKIIKWNKSDNDRISK